MRIACSRLTTKILPSPILPVLAALVIASIGVTLLPAEAFDFSNGNALHADFGQRLAHVVQLERLDDGSD
jgi:hypothetical protein